MTPNSSPPTSSRGRSGGVSSDGGDFRALVEGRITSKEYVRRLRKRVGEQHLAANGCHSAVERESAMTDERITEIGRLVAELHAEAVASENPYALAKLNSDLAAVGLLRLVAGCFADVAKSTR